ncbi:Hypothetical_protein [Hexamita inflata]|uniref:Hypothetical_protein n=1 Tax=Hexamita inflata TaxID=28002 RepID=A0AA86UAW0_9EUKA|nr:Hypothetical protein HINF_LOCUS33016 [Hexamita inflata]
MNFAPIVLTYEPRTQMQQQQQFTPSNPRPLSVKRIYSQTPQLFQNKFFLLTSPSSPPSSSSYRPQAHLKSTTDLNPGPTPPFKQQRKRTRRTRFKRNSRGQKGRQKQRRRPKNSSTNGRKSTGTSSTRNPKRVSCEHLEFNIQFLFSFQLSKQINNILNQYLQRQLFIQCRYLYNYIFIRRLASPKIPISLMLFKIH